MLSSDYMSSSILGNMNHSRGEAHTGPVVTEKTCWKLASDGKLGSLGTFITMSP